MLYDRSQFDDSLLDNETDPSLEDPNKTIEEGITPQEEPTNEEPIQDPNQELEDPDSDLDAFAIFLKSRGVRDGKTIVYEDEDTGETKEVDFNSLDKQEQLEILNSLADPGLTEDEIRTINLLRKNNTTLQDVISYYQQKAIDEYIEKNNISPTYSIDSYSDDDLYIADQKSKYPEMSDEELQTELEIAKSNEELFKKKVDLIRKQYQKLEEENIREQEEAEKAQQKEYQDKFANILNGFESISLDYKDPKSDKIVIEERDKNQIFDYVFKPTTNGVSKFVEDLSNPEIVAKLAWFQLFGEETMSDISNYWKDELKKVRRNATPAAPKNTVVVRQPEHTDKPINKPKYGGNEKTISSEWEKIL